MKAHSVTTSPTLLWPAGTIAGHILYNASDETLYFAPDGDAAVTASTGIPIAPGQHIFYEPVSFGPAGPPACYVIHGGTGSKLLRYGNSAYVAA